MNIIGTIRGASYMPSGGTSCFCRYQLVCGDKWSVVEGSSSGQTQTALVDRSVGGGGEGMISLTGDVYESASGAASVVWEHPLDAHLACGALAGWPQLMVTLWQQDEYQRNEIIGYGMVMVPVAPGLHNLEVATWRPEGTWLQELKATFIGGGLPQLTDTTLVVNPTLFPRYGLSTTTSATVELEINVIVRGFEGVALSA